MEGRYAGTEGEIHYRVWEPDGDPQRVVLIAHGYAEHIGRYEHVAAALTAARTIVYGCDHLGHGRSDGDRTLITDFGHVVEDLHRLAELARTEHPGLPTVLIGHSMGGLIATLYAERYGDELAGLVLSGPVLGEWEAAHQLLAAPQIPAEPLDVTTLSRDPDVGRAYAEDPLVYRGPFLRPTLEALVAAIEQASADDSRVMLPILYVHGEEDQLVPIKPPREAVEHLPSGDKTIRTYPGARHEVFNEINKDEVLAEVVVFADRVTAP